MAKYRDLIVFQKADELAFGIYKATETFPKSETFGLTSHLRRASLSMFMRGRKRHQSQQGSNW